MYVQFKVATTTALEIPLYLRGDYKNLTKLDSILKPDISSVYTFCEI